MRQAKGVEAEIESSDSHNIGTSRVVPRTSSYQPATSALLMDAQNMF